MSWQSPSKFLEVCINSEYMWYWSPVYNFNRARALKKLLSACVEVNATLPKSDTYVEGFTYVKAFIQICLTLTLLCWINKTDGNQNMTFEYFNTKSHRDRWKQKQPFTFWYCFVNFYPWKDIVGKKMSKLRAFYVPSEKYPSLEVSL
jgi:hypothetical protein